MANNDDSDTGSDAAARFTIDLAELDLTDEDINSLQNQITKAVVEGVTHKGFAMTAERKKKGPYVKITFVKSVPRPR